VFVVLVLVSSLPMFSNEMAFEDTVNVEGSDGGRNEDVV
jgi:hypothetical protein